MPVYFRMMRYSGMYYFSRSRVRGSGSGSAAGLGPWPFRDREKEQHINIERDLVPGAQGDPGPGGPGSHAHTRENPAGWRIRLKSNINQGEGVDNGSCAMLHERRIES